MIYCAASRVLSRSNCLTCCVELVLFFCTYFLVQLFIIINDIPVDCFGSVGAGAVDF